MAWSWSSWGGAGEHSGPKLSTVSTINPASLRPHLGPGWLLQWKKWSHRMEWKFLPSGPLANLALSLHTSLSLLPLQGHLVSSQHFGNFLGYGPPSGFLYFRASPAWNSPGHLGLSYLCEPMEEGRQHCPHSTGRDAEPQKLWMSWGFLKTYLDTSRLSWRITVLSSHLNSPCHRGM